MAYLLSVMTFFSLAFIGMASLNFAMDKPYKQLLAQRNIWFNTKFLKPIYLRFLGWFFLALALILSIQTWGFSIGLAAYFGLLTLVVGMLIFLLSYQTTWILKLVLIAGVICIFNSLVITLI